ncbi:MAG: hypothetical protein ACOCYP_02690 [Planctomycetota bacterium]
MRLYLLTPLILTGLFAADSAATTEPTSPATIPVSLDRSFAADPARDLLHIADSVLKLRPATAGADGLSFDVSLVDGLAPLIACAWRDRQPTRATWFVPGDQPQRVQVTDGSGLAWLQVTRYDGQAQRAGLICA